jgi:uncharacterized repeat protein (TIGR03806 family)
VFADYVSGNIWSIQFDGQTATPLRWLARDPAIAAFGTDPRNGDVLFGDLGDDQVKRLTYSTNVVGAPLPPTLADTGAFADLPTLTPHAGILPYELNVPFWSDGAAKQRWFSIPSLDAKIGFDPAGNWSVPDGSVWVKHFELELTNGVPESRRRLETRFIVRNPSGMYGITYRWDASQTNAVLVPEEGLDEEFQIRDTVGTRAQVWHYPSRAECLACHTPAGGYVLGFNTAQLNRDTIHGNVTENQLRILNRLGYFQTNLTRFHTLPALARAEDPTASLEHRVRSYLSVNCAQCHQPGSTGVGLFDARSNTPTDQAQLINGPLNDNEGDPDNRVVAPGSPERSMLLTRINALGPTRMPPIASSVIDASAVALLSAWITNDLPAYRSFEQWQIDQFGSAADPRAQADADPDQDGASNRQEYRTGTNPLVRNNRWGIAVERSSGGVRLSFPGLANRAHEIQSAMTLSEPLLWETLEIPENRPTFPAVASEAAVVLPATNQLTEYFRVLIRAP